MPLVLVVLGYLCVASAVPLLRKEEESLALHTDAAKGHLPQDGSDVGVLAEGSEQERSDKTDSLRSGGMRKVIGSDAMNPHLIFDVGFNTGGDTRNYATYGYDVIGVEANPQLIADAKTKPYFSRLLDSGRLTLLNNAVVQDSDAGPLPFWEYKGQEGVWGSVGKPHPRCEACGTCCSVTADIYTITCETLMQKYGVPLYMKVDIEELDASCIKGIDLSRSPAQLPRFLSFEHSGSTSDDISVLKHLRCLGYTKFKNLEQGQYNVRSEDFSGQHSGPFGLFAADASTGTLLWHSYEDFAKEGGNWQACAGNGKWCDVHAMLPEIPAPRPKDCELHRKLL